MNHEEPLMTQKSVWSLCITAGSLSYWAASPTFHHGQTYRIQWLTDTEQKNWKSRIPDSHTHRFRSKGAVFVWATEEEEEEQGVFFINDLQLTKPKVTHMLLIVIRHHSQQVILMYHTDPLMCNSLKFLSAQSPLVGSVKEPLRPWVTSAWNCRINLMTTWRCSNPALSYIWVSSPCD